MRAAEASALLLALFAVGCDKGEPASAVDDTASVDDGGDGGGDGGDGGDGGGSGSGQSDLGGWSHMASLTARQSGRLPLAQFASRLRVKSSWLGCRFSYAG